VVVLWWRFGVCLHAICVTLAVVSPLLRRLLSVICVLVLVMATLGASRDEPAVVGEGWEAFADTAAGVEAERGC